MLAIVLFYSVLVFAQLAMDDPEIEKLLGAGGTDITAMHDAFLKVDLCFLVFFTVEIVVKLYGFGAAYLRDLFNLVDAAIVLGSFVITVVAIDIGETDPHPNRNRHRHRHRHPVLVFSVPIILQCGHDDEFRTRCAAVLFVISYLCGRFARLLNTHCPVLWGGRHRDNAGSAARPVRSNII